MRHAANRLRQRGATTLVVVMMLIIVMALLAAYGNRSLLFEQRIASGYARSGLSQEMSEASIGWAVALLNGPAVDTDCKPANAPTGGRFVDRFLEVSAGDRSIKQVGKLGGISADCVRDGDKWVCRCPKVGDRTVPNPLPSEGLAPSFGISFEAGPRPGTVVINARGCTSSVVDNCRSEVDNTRNLLAVSYPRTLLALVSAVRTPPSAPLVAKGGLEWLSGDGLGLHNTDPRTSGMLYVLGGKSKDLQSSRLESLPGTPVESARIEEDPVLSKATSEDVFRMFMGMAVGRYANHPALHVVDCSSDCAAKLAAAYTAGWRMLWVKNAATFGSGAILGSEADPVVLIVDGDVTLSGGLNLTGMLVARGNLDWTNNTASASLVTGSVLVEGSVTTKGRMDIHFRQAVADQMRNRLGSYVPVSGSWFDALDKR